MDRALKSGLLLLRFILVLHTLVLLMLAGLAGEFLSGTDGVVKFHEYAAFAALAICFLQTGAAAAAQRSGNVSLWLLIGTILVLLAEGLQIGTGFGRFLRVHIPLGVIVFGVVLVQTISVFRPAREMNR